MSSPRALVPALCILAASAGPASAAGPGVALAAVKGKVLVAPPKEGAFAPGQVGAVLAEGARLKTEAGAEATLRFPDGIESVVKEKSEILIRLGGGGAPSGVTLFLGRVWSKVTKSVGASDKYEVRSANAVAGVRGTEFDVGVALDGSTRVVVKEGKVGVSSDDRESGVGGGEEVESDNDGRLGKVGKAPAEVDWNAWFVARAKEMETRGLKVAKALDGRLNKQKKKVEELRKKQLELKRKIEKLSAAAKGGADVRAELERALAELERVTERLESMRSRLEGAFGLFAKWGEAAEGGGMANAPQIRAMAADIEKVARDFADMIEEGTDLSEESMDDMMKDMGKGKLDGPGESAGDELFR